MTLAHGASVITGAPAGPIDLLASDMDGTLLDGDHNISNSVLEAIMKLETSTRVAMCIATGRSRSSAMKKLQSHGLDWSQKPGVFLNGAVVYGPGGEIVYENKFPYQIIKRLIGEFENETDSVVIMPCVGDSIHAPQVCEISLHLHKEYADPFPVQHDGYAGMLEGIQDMSVHMIGIMTKDCRRTEALVFDRVKGLLSEDFEAPEEFSVVLPIPRMVTIMPRGTSKGAGLLALCRFLSICPSRVAAVGDAGNDIEMIQSVGFGVAMGNAKDEVKKHAKFVVNRNDHPELPGVADLINRLVVSASI